MEKSILKLKKVAELREIAKAYGIDGCDKMKKAEIIAAIMGNSEDTDEKIQVEEIENVKEPELECVKEQRHGQDGQHIQHVQRETRQKTRQEYSDQERPQVEGILDIAEG